MGGSGASRRWIQKIRKWLKDNGAQTESQVAAGLKVPEAVVQLALWSLARTARVTASGALDNPATTYTWNGV